MTGVDPEKVLRVLSSVASGFNIGETTTSLLQKSVALTQASSSAKVLATDLIHFGALSDKDWEIIISSLKTGLSSQHADDQILSLEILPSLPALHLTQLVLQDGVCDFVMVRLKDNDPGVRSKAAAALGHILTHLDVVKAITRHQKSVDGYEEYWNNICDLLIDKDDQSAGSAFQAIESLMCAAKDQNNADAGSPWTVLLRRWADKCFQRLFANLAAILHRARRLDCAGTIAAIGVLFEMGEQIFEREDKSQESRTMSWALSAICSLLEENLSSVDPALVHQSAERLLQLARKSSEIASKAWSLTASISTETLSLNAVLALESLLESKETIPARGDIILTITKHLKQLELSQLISIATRQLQNISALPRSTDRTRSLMYLWRAVLYCDLSVRRIRASTGDIMPGVSLQAVLESPFFSAVVAGHQKQPVDYNFNKLIIKASYPAFKQEVVSSLMEVVEDHVKEFDIESIFPKNASNSKTADRIESAIISDLQSSVIDWFTASIVALCLTQACLGWDNVAVDGYYGLTLPSDLWLQLLQLASRTLYSILNHYDIFYYTDLGSLSEEQAKTKVGRILKTLSAEVFEIQKLMKKMVFHWSFLNPAFRPRALWVVCHHIELPDRAEDTWNNIKDSLTDLFVSRPSEMTKKAQHDRLERSKQGQLPSSTESMYSIKSTEESRPSYVAFDNSEVAFEGITVGLACLERLTEILSAQYHYPDFPKYYRSVRAIAAMLKDICNQVLEEDSLTVDTFDHCKMLLKRLDYISDNPPDGVAEVKRASTEEIKEVTHLPVDLSSIKDEGFPFSNSWSLYFLANKRTRRHQALRYNLCKGRSDTDPPRRPKTDLVSPIPETPTEVDLATAVGGLNLKDDESDWKILTGQGDPVELSLRHKIDAFARIMEVEIRAENKMGSSDITGVIVSFAVDGPVTTDREGMIVWYPEKLPAKEPVVHRFQLGLVEFGPIEIQPFMDVALRSVGEDMPALSVTAYSIPLVDLLLPLSITPTPKFYFQEVSSWPKALTTTAVCRWPGTNGGMQLLSAFNSPKLKKIWPESRTSLCIFQAVYVLCTFHDIWISFSISGQLVDLQRMGLATWALPSGRLATGNTGYYLCKCTFSSCSAVAIESIRARQAELLSDLSGGGLVLGLDPGVGRPPPPPPIHPDVHVDLGHDQSSSRFSDLQSLALEEWKRLNSC